MRGLQLRNLERFEVRSGERGLVLGWTVVATIGILIDNRNYFGRELAHIYLRRQLVHAFLEATKLLPFFFDIFLNFLACCFVLK
jgi:hypothetical protein